MMGMFLAERRAKAWALLLLYLQIAKGVTPTTAGLALLPLTLGIMIGSIVAGQAIAKTGRYKVFPVSGTFFLVLGAAFLSRLMADSSFIGRLDPRLAAATAGAATVGAAAVSETDTLDGTSGESAAP